ncbi:MAG: galactokinase [Gemmatimonadota bacterium]
MLDTGVRDRVVEAFRREYGEAPTWVVRAPGRVNLIGEHTDYNDGFVLPLALERAVWLALRPRPDGRVRVYSADYDEAAEFSLDDLTRGGPGWSEYLKGTAWALADAGYGLKGWDGAMGSDVPIGAGLSSSAAVELATARALASASGLDWEPAEMARLAQRAENEWVGMNCGIMDQMISAVGRAGHAVLIDCRTLDTEVVPVPDGTVVVVLDTATRRGLVDSEYNERRQRCERAAEHFGVAALRDLTPETLAERAGELDEVTARRARHVVTENARTEAAAAAMRRGDAGTLGRLMDESHASLRNDFEVSSEALDLMVDIARAQPGCEGARMTGAGFGGCAVALVDRERAEAFATAVTAAYRERTDREPQVYVTAGSDGAAVVTGG